MPYVLLVLHAVNINYTGTVFLFRQTHRNNIGPFRQAKTYISAINCTNVIDFGGNTSQLKYSFSVSTNS